MSSLNKSREQTAGSERSRSARAPFPVTQKSSLAAASVSLTGIRLGAVWRAEDGKYVLNLLLCPTADPRAWERSCWSSVPRASSAPSLWGFLSLHFPVLPSPPTCPSAFPPGMQGRSKLRGAKRQPKCQWGQQAAASRHSAQLTVSRPQKKLED